MELGEANALAGTFVLSLMFRAHSIPLDDRSDAARRWWQHAGSRIPLPAACQERRRHTAMFASRRRTERRNGREIWLEISAIVDDYGGGTCPALADGLCRVYERRPLTCRTVPLHYSRSPSVLQAYLDKFTATADYECDTAGGPVILDGSSIVSDELRDLRSRAVAVAKADRAWKAQLLSFMDDPGAAERAGLPTYDSIVAIADGGYATQIPMIVAWRVAEQARLISADELSRLCLAQAACIRAELIRSASAQELRALLPLYEAGAAGQHRL
jgi:Fe-S-cluster containining protein